MIDDDKLKQQLIEYQSKNFNDLILNYLFFIHEFIDIPDHNEFIDLIRDGLEDPLRINFDSLMKKASLIAQSPLFDFAISDTKRTIEDLESNCKRLIEENLDLRKQLFKARAIEKSAKGKTEDRMKKSRSLQDIDLMHEEVTFFDAPLPVEIINTSMIDLISIASVMLQSTEEVLRDVRLHNVPTKPVTIPTAIDFNEADILALHVQSVIKGYQFRMSKRMIVKEIVETEKNYVQCLLFLFRDYKTEFFKNKKQLGLSDEKIEGLFPCLPALLEKHVDFLRSMVTRISRWNMFSTFGDLFLDAVDIDLYVAYVSKFDLTMDAHHEAMEKSNVASFVKNSGVNLEMSDMTISPVQRIPRYILLVKQLLKYTDKRHKDFPLLNQAYERLSEIASFIDQKRREAEQYQNIIKLQENILNCPFPIAKPDRYIVTTFDSLEQSNRDIAKKKPRHVVITNDLIVCLGISTKTFSYEKVFDFKWLVPVLECQIGIVEKRIEMSDDEKLFAVGIVWNGKKGLEKRIFYLKNEKQRDEFLSSFEKVKKACVDSSRAIAQRKETLARVQIKKQSFSRERRIACQERLKDLEANLEEEENKLLKKLSMKQRQQSLKKISQLEEELSLQRELLLQWEMVQDY
ncbi:Dbl homology domain-containing protein [Rozella allomycis CSF55]|uniref:Dbl homology domain-containing protein n=1 Tax=Rozella allomycis (strain CSF55) TaxID=988480 RepID=A0A075AUG2_ROZAC|nr:putative Guanine nucleotide exchange factor for Rho/Rac/Cdc42-like GTPases 1 [Rozella allomycis CSF55]RKP20847.1 Dbl homology domain-containing protein [Rozella allomycis CSF55]|eukprot:EPZ33903.1 putative Guanine nucleotide exchange factor for Rho/Rac/Cdc42-like GTPases 1 [Rozella allomycis CSF55]